ncbi:MAG: NAD(P)-binding protein [Firmicutes bacterium]|nr:NAD(P)-binding protein [Bacillota bacterium]
MKKIAIIGAGVSGMTAGIYAQKMGFKTEIYEKHAIAGGECTGWTREGYHIDGCIHWLTGTKKDGGTLNTMWRDTGALGDDIEIIEHDSFGMFEAHGHRINLSRNLDEFKNQLLAISPEDKEEIEILCEYLKIFKNSEPPKDAIDILDPREKIKMLKENAELFKLMKKLSLSAKEYSERFKHPLIKSLLQDWFFYSECCDEPVFDELWSFYRW